MIWILLPLPISSSTISVSKRPPWPNKVSLRSLLLKPSMVLKWSEYTNLPKALAYCNLNAIYSIPALKWLFSEAPPLVESWTILVNYKLYTPIQGHNMNIIFLKSINWFAQSGVPPFPWCFTRRSPWRWDWGASMPHTAAPQTPPAVQIWK